MRPAAALVLVLLLGGSAFARAQSPQDSLGIRQAALDYIEGWYAGDDDRMARALHAELAKRIVFSDTLGNVWVRGMGATELIRGTRAGGERGQRADRRGRMDRLPPPGEVAGAVGYPQRPVGGPPGWRRPAAVGGGRRAGDRR